MQRPQRWNFPQTEAARSVVCSTLIVSHGPHSRTAIHGSSSAHVRTAAGTTTYCWHCDPCVRATCGPANPPDAHAYARACARWDTNDAHRPQHTYAKPRRGRFNALRRPGQPRNTQNTCTTPAQMMPVPIRANPARPVSMPTPMVGAGGRLQTPVERTFPCRARTIS